MEVYILDSQLRREQVVDSFESLIWTERWSEIGDFELRLPSTLASRTMFILGAKLAMNESYRVMMVETVEDAMDESGQATLVVKGRSLEAITEERVAKNSLEPIRSNGDQFGYPGKPLDIIKNVFHMFLGTAPLGVALTEDDKIPFLQQGTWLPLGNIPPSQTELVWTTDIGTLFDFIKSICDTYELGFRLVRKFDTSELYFEAYTGNDLTSSQSVLPAVIFSPSFDNLQNTSELTTLEGSKNVAYVFNEDASVIVYEEGSTVYPKGFDRRVLLVKADKAPETFNIGVYLQQKGREELAKHKSVSVFDGEMNQNNAYKYGVDYNLGDKVEMRNTDGVVTIRRVTEQIFVSDPEGERSYPTLSASSALYANTWVYQGASEWAEKADAAYWDNQ